MNNYMLIAVRDHQVAIVRDKLKGPTDEEKLYYQAGEDFLDPYRRWLSEEEDKVYLDAMQIVSELGKQTKPYLRRGFALYWLKKPL